MALPGRMNNVSMDYSVHYWCFLYPFSVESDSEGLLPSLHCQTLRFRTYTLTGKGEWYTAHKTCSNTHLNLGGQ